MKKAFDYIVGTHGDENYFVLFRVSVWWYEREFILIHAYTHPVCAIYHPRIANSHYDIAENIIPSSHHRIWICGVY